MEKESRRSTEQRMRRFYKTLYNTELIPDLRAFKATGLILEIEGPMGKAAHEKTLSMLIRLPTEKIEVNEDLGRDMIFKMERSSLSQEAKERKIRDMILWSMKIPSDRIIVKKTRCQLKFLEIILDPNLSDQAKLKRAAFLLTKEEDLFFRKDLRQMYMQHWKAYKKDHP